MPEPKTKSLKVKIISDGTAWTTKVLDQDGTPIENVVRAEWSSGYDKPNFRGLPTLTLTLIDVEVEIEADVSLVKETTRILSSEFEEKYGD